MVFNFNMHVSCSDTAEHDHFSPTFTSLVIAWLAIILVADLVGNTLVIIVILKNPSLRDQTQTTFFLLNLAIADLLVALVIPFSINSAYKQCWDMPMFLCKNNSFLVTLSLLTSIHTLIYISIHKFVSLRRVTIKNEFNVPVSRKTSCIMIVAAWMYALVFSIMTVMSDPNYKEMTLQCGPRYPVVGDETFYLHIANQIGNRFIPLVILMFCYTRVFMYIRQHANEQRRLSSSSSDGNTSQSEKSVTLTLVIVLAFFLLSWVPYIVYTKYKTIVEGEKNDIPYYLNPLAYCYGFMNSACNPLIYAWRFPNFKKVYTDIFNKSMYFVTFASFDVVFMSQFSQTLVNLANGHIVAFDDVITNVGHAYSPVTGVFRAPVYGNYMFSMIGTVKLEPGGHALHLLLKRNGNTIGYIFLDSNHDYYLKRTEVDVVSLTSGDYIFVQVDAVNGNHSLVGC